MFKIGNELEHISARYSGLAYKEAAKRADRNALPVLARTH